MSTAGRNKGLTMCSKDILRKPKGIILIEFTKIRWFSRQSGGGGWFLLSKAESLKTTQVRSSDLSPLGLDVLVMARREDGPVTLQPLKGCILLS
jgi:hypothetical protein